MKFSLIASCFLLAVTAFAASPTWTTPSKVAVAAFSVDDYIHVYYGYGLKDLQRTREHKEVFVDSLFSRVNRKYPGKRTFKTYNRHDYGSTMDEYRKAVLYRSEIVFFSGHGDQQRICLQDYPINISEGCGSDVCAPDEYGKIYSGDVRWVIFDACLVLNINKSNKLEYPLSNSVVDITKFNKLKEVFGGVHAILGFSSLSWEKYRMNSEGYFAKSETLYNYFTEKFIDYDETIWDAFSLASGEIVRDFSIFPNPQGLTPAIAFLRGYDANGRYHDTSKERFNHTFNQPIQINGSLEMYVKYDEYGDAEYYPTIYF